MDSDLDMPANSDSDGGENDQEVMAEIETWLGTLSWTWQRWKARTGPGWTWSNGIEVRQEPGNHPAKAVQQAHILLHVSQIPPLHPPPFMSQMDYEVACLAKLAFESLASCRTNKDSNWSAVGLIATMVLISVFLLTTFRKDWYHPVLSSLFEGLVHHDMAAYRVYSTTIKQLSHAHHK